MKLADLKNMVECRHDQTGFLHISDINKLNAIFKGGFTVDGKGFKEVCEKAFELYSQKAITNRALTKIIEVCCDSNGLFRIESHRFEKPSIFEYDEHLNSYIFLKTGTLQEFNKLLHYID